MDETEHNEAPNLPNCYVCGRTEDLKFAEHKSGGELICRPCAREDF